MQKDLYRAAAKVSEAKSHRNEIMRKFEYKHKPFRRGDRTTITGWSYTGRECLVQTCTLAYDKYKKEFYWTIKCCILNANGKPSKLFTSFDRKLEEGK